MKKVLYEIVAANLTRLQREMVREYIKFNSYSRLDDDFIQTCGWEIAEFDKETLRRIDNNWSQL